MDYPPLTLLTVEIFIRDPLEGLRRAALCGLSSFSKVQSGTIIGQGPQRHHWLRQLPIETIAQWSCNLRDSCPSQSYISSPWEKAHDWDHQWFTPQNPPATEQHALSVRILHMILPIYIVLLSCTTISLSHCCHCCLIIPVASLVCVT